MSEFANKISRQLEKLLKEKRVSHTELAAKIEKSQGAITHWTSGASQPNLENLNKIANELKMNTVTLISYLLEIDTPKPEIHKLVDCFSNMTNELYGVGLEVKRNTNMFITGNEFDLFTLRCFEIQKQKLEIYPVDSTFHLFSEMAGGHYLTEEDKYIVINGNIYRENDNITELHLLNWSKMYHSIYDSVNDGKSIEPYRKAYEKERYRMGLIGVLSADEFYMLSYILGYFSKSISKD
jgi:transcriptional regulator with XRE-family HTH domain